MSRRAWAWGLAGLGLVVALAAWRLGPGRAGSPVAGPGAAASAPVALSLAAGDVVTARDDVLTRALAVSGGLRAVNSAVVRAKVAAEVRDLPLREGDRVAAGQVVARLDDTEYRFRLQQTLEQAASAQAQLDITERTLANNRALVEQGFISRNALETSLSQTASARASLQAAQAAAELARKAVADTVLRAPLAGQVSQRLVQPGERVGVDARLMEIVDVSRLELEAAIAPEDLPGLRVGQTARLQVDGLAEPVNARVARINPSTQAGTRAVMVYLAVDPHPDLRQGLFARGQVEVQRQTARVVPASALRLEGALPQVAVVVPDGSDPRAGRVVLRTVRSGTSGQAVFDAAPEAALAIEEGLQAGERVLRGSVGRLRDGTRVTLPAATAAPAAAPSPAAPASSGR